MDDQECIQARDARSAVSNWGAECLHSSCLCSFSTSNGRLCRRKIIMRR
jgi:hypothetical protein